jgi:hypothetical protein
MIPIPRPDPSEYAPFQATYVASVPDGDVMTLLRAQRDESRSLFASISEEQSRHRYAPGKWSIREVAGHLADAERVFSYRAMRFARGDGTALPGFDENAYVRNAALDSTPLAEHAAHFAAVRDASIALFSQFNDSELARRGMASGYPVSVRALAYVIAGHERHHLEILRTRYLAT